MSSDEDDNDKKVAKAKHPHLYSYLKEQLPTLGLDLDTYGPYVWGITGDIQDAVGNDDNVVLDMEELMQVVELLQASSETHCDNEEVWIQLLGDIEEKVQLDVEHHKQEKERLKQEKKIQMETQLAKAKQEKEQQTTEVKPKAQSSSTAVDEETKKALMQRYGYDEPDATIDQEPDTGKSVNKQAAEAANMAKVKDMRSQKTQTKKDEQQKTKEQRQSKEKSKEERRKKAQKGERKR